VRLTHGGSAYVSGAGGDVECNDVERSDGHPVVAVAIGERSRSLVYAPVVDAGRCLRGRVQRGTPRWALGAVFTVIVLGTVGVGCGSDGDGPSDTTQPSAALANPASEYCVAQGGTVEIVEGDGGQQGICVLPDGTRVDEWEYFRQETGGTVPDE
jgi:hypothetical protein